VLGFFSSLFGGLTHYGTGPAQIFFGSDLVELKHWLIFGVLISVVNLAIWYGLGLVWWKMIGIY
jgi:DASS family divalent anion:Na+ symporter